MGLIGNLMVKLGINTSQFTSGLNGAANAANSFSQSLARSFKQANNSSQNAGQQMNVFAKGTKSTFKDIGRIAQGIVIAQAFYRTTNAIQGATAAVAQFSSQCEQAQASFGLLMKDQPKADRFMRTVENFAAKTPYTFQQAADNARKLLAYGFSSSNMEPIMNTLADASSAAGDPEAFNRVGKALGQIHTKGKLAAQELLQLTEAGIPAFDILKEKLKLTNDQLGKIGQLKIPADVAINAILKGMQERYGGAAQVMSNTVNGMLSTIKDNALIIGKEAFSPLYDSFKGVIRKVRDASDRMREAVREGGLGGLLRTIIPPDIFPKIQLLAANLRLLRENFVLVMQAIWPVIKALGESFLNVLNMVLPFINALTRVLAIIGQYLTSTSSAVRMLVGAFLGLIVAGWVTQLLLNFGVALRGLFIVKAVAQLIIWLAQAIRLLAVAMVASPWVALLGVAAGALLYLGLTSKKVSGWISGIGSGITKAFGADPSKEFAPKMKKNTDIADEFNKNLTVSKESLDQMGDSAKKAGKKAKDALMSFDEVFNLKDQTDETDVDPDLGDIGDIGTIPAISIPEPEFPEVTTPIQNWVDTFKDTIITKLKNTLAGAGIGAAIGAVIGGLLGGPGGAVLGAKIGALAGGIVGFFWDQMSEQMKDTVKGAGVGAGIGAVIGGFLGGPVGAVIGAAIGSLAGGIVTWFWDDIKKFFMSSTGQGAAAGAGIGGIIGFTFGGPLGAGIGAALGSVIGGVVEHFWEDIKNFFQSDTGQGASIGTGIGATLGFIFGGPLGAALGGGLGAAIGGIVGHFWDDMVKWFTSDTGKGATSGAVIGASIGTMLGGPIGTAVGAVIGGIIGANWKAITQWWDDTKAGMSIWWNETTEGFTTWWTDIENGIVMWCINTGVKMHNWWEDTKTGFKTWCADTKAGISQWWDDVEIGLATWCINTAIKISTWWKDTKEGFNLWCKDVKTNLSDWWSGVEEGFTTWSTNVHNNMSTWWADTKLGFSTWWTDTKTGLGTWWSDTKTGFSDWKSETGNHISDWATSTGDAFGLWWTTGNTGFSTWWSDTKTGFSDWKTEVGNSISGWYNDTYGSLSNWWANTSSSFGGWWSDSKWGFTDWASGIYDGVTGWFDKLATKLQGFFDKLAFWKKKANDEESSASSSASSAESSKGQSLRGHARGGVFNKEHVANFAENDKAEAIIPLENEGAMAPFVNAVASGLTSSLGSVVAQINSAARVTTQPGTPGLDNRPILYVGTLIADDRSLKELNRKMNVIQLKEDNRRG